MSYSAIPRAFAAALASRRRRFANSPPPIWQCPASPLVTETNFTMWPFAANLAAIPPDLISASSGWAPKAITRITPSWATAAPALSNIIKRMVSFMLWSILVFFEKSLLLVVQTDVLALDKQLLHVSLDFERIAV